jgi:hypothetical protein
MEKVQQVYREILYQAIEKNERSLTQLELAKRLRVSLSLVNFALKPLRQMGAIDVGRRKFDVVSVKKILLYWASIRKLERDLVFSASVASDVVSIEKAMPDGVIFTAYSGFKFRFRDVPADYSEVYVYANAAELAEIKKRFRFGKGFNNLFVLKKDQNAERYPQLPLANLFVDLWQLREWYAKDFIKALEERLEKWL